jgi:hypothetical protein
MTPVGKSLSLAAGRPPIDADRARAVAESLHDGQLDAGGVPLIEHVGRVAAAVSRDARVVAWLHEVFEHTSISAESLLAEGVSTADLRALKLLTRDQDSHSNASYLAHVHEIADARGTGARIARSVKRADLADRAVHRSVRPDGWSPPYELGLAILQRPASVRPSAQSLGPPTTDPEFRAERLGMALRGLAAELVDERRKVAQLRQEVAELRSVLESDTQTQPNDEAAPASAGRRRVVRDAERRDG